MPFRGAGTCPLPAVRTRQYGTAAVVDDAAQSVLRAVDVAQLLADASEVDTARQQGMTE